MSLSTIEQLCRDVATVNAATSHANITANTVSLYNANSLAAKASHPNNSFLELLPEVTLKTVYCDLLIMTGQLKEAIKEALSENRSPRRVGLSA